MHNTKSLVKKNLEAGFTLIEILVVIGLIAVLAAVVLIAINPARQFRQGRDAERRSEINTILNAIGQYIADTKGVASALSTIDSDAATFEGINTADLGNGFCTALVPTYVSALPVDPTSGPPDQVKETDCDSAGETFSTGYLINRDAGGRVTIRANGEEPVASIEVTR